MSIRKLFENGATPNILIIITDQQRSLETWPDGFRKTLLTQLPAEQRLRKNGLDFHHAFTGAAMCTPSRATFLTSNYPAVTGAKRTGVGTLPPPNQFANLATVLGRSGYTCVWKGKWHLCGSNNAVPGEFGWSGWDPPDSGTTLGVDPTLGGPLTGDADPPSTRRPTNGPPENDQQVVADSVAFLKDPPQGPWCLVVSLVNPHDVHVARLATANQSGELMSGNFDSGFTTTDLSNVAAPLPPPDSRDEDLSSKPRAQAGMVFKNLAPSCTPHHYINFYAYLQTLIDGAVGQVISAVTDDGTLNGNLPDNLLIIRFSDHGELGLSHGLVEKFYNAYDETIRVPLVFTNQQVWPSGEHTEAMASLVDLLPTLRNLLGYRTSDFNRMAGRNLTRVLDAPNTESVQEYVHFTYDDITSTTGGPSVIRAIRGKHWMYAVYMNSDNSAPADWEMYDLSQPGQLKNLAGVAAYGSMQSELDRHLVNHMSRAGTTPPGAWPPPDQAGVSVGGPPPSQAATSYDVRRLPGVDEARAFALIYAGIHATSALLQRMRSGTPHQLAIDTGLSEPALIRLVGLAELMTIDGIGPAEVGLLDRVGVRTPAALSAESPAALCARLSALAASEVDAETGHPIWYGPAPDVNTVASWITQI